MLWTQFRAISEKPAPCVMSGERRAFPPASETVLRKSEVLGAPRCQGALDLEDRLCIFRSTGVVVTLRSRPHGPNQDRRVLSFRAAESIEDDLVEEAAEMAHDCIVRRLAKCHVLISSPPFTSVYPVGAADSAGTAPQ